MNFITVSSDFSNAFFDLTDKAKNISITSHVSPDDDSISSVLAMAEILILKYPSKSIKIIISATPQNQYHSFKNYEKIEFVQDIADALGDTDLLIMLDGGQYSRFSAQPDKLSAVPTTVCIDHHGSPIDKFTLSLVSTSHPACTEIVYLTFCKEKSISVELAEIFLMGILGDTGNFTYLKANQTETLIISKRLLDISKIELQEFLSRYRSIPVRIFEIVQEYTKNTKFGHDQNWPNFQYSYIDSSFIKSGNYTDSEVADAGNIYTSRFLGAVEGHPWGFIVSPRVTGEIKISARSLPNCVSVRDLMERMSLGGGHDRAAGGTFKNTGHILGAMSCIEEILKWMNCNKPLIN